LYFNVYVHVHVAALDDIDVGKLTWFARDAETTKKTDEKKPLVCDERLFYAMR
jgi:hypothetical protein